jgi:Domain of unknown function (DUF5668)/B-box zinc finger
MNCANHSQNTAVAYCRTCGKPLCASCTRPVMGVIYCETCLAERVGGTTPPASPYQPAPGYAGRVPATGPNPALAGILAGFFPFGVGAVYCGQYAKGLAHFIVMVLLIVGQANANSDTVHLVLGLCMGGFYFYQLIDAIRSAKAIQAGLPAPDPFGLGTMFSPGDRQDFSRGIPVGAIVLIGLGVLFLLQNLNIWFLEFDRMWPLALIFLGVWLYAKRRVSSDCRNRSIAGPAILVTIGVLSLIENLHGPSWAHTWPVILLVLGILKLMERGYLGGPPSPPLGPPPGAPSSQQSPTEVSSEVKNG